jgi:hypothetical protein
MTEPSLAAALRSCAAGYYAAEAACELIIATYWPHRDDFGAERNGPDPSGAPPQHPPRQARNRKTPGHCAIHVKPRQICHWCRSRMPGPLGVSAAATRPGAMPG